MVRKFLHKKPVLSIVGGGLTVAVLAFGVDILLLGGAEHPITIGVGLLGALTAGIAAMALLKGDNQYPTLGS